MLLGEGLSSLSLGGSGLLGLELIEGETNKGLLDSLGSSSSLLGVGLSLTFLVHLSPCLSPVELNRLDSLSEERSNLVADEEVDLSVLRDETLTSTGVNAKVCKLAEFSLDNHLSTTKKKICEILGSTIKIDLFTELSIG